RADAGRIRARSPIVLGARAWLVHRSRSRGGPGGSWRGSARGAPRDIPQAARCATARSAADVSGHGGSLGEGAKAPYGGTHRRPGRRVMAAAHDFRSEARVEASFRVRYSTPDQLVVADGRDLSKGGMFLATRTFLPVNAVLRVQLELPD